VCSRRQEPRRRNFAGRWTCLPAKRTGHRGQPNGVTDLTNPRLGGWLAWDRQDQYLGHSRRSKQQSWTVSLQWLAASEVSFSQWSVLHWLPSLHILLYGKHVLPWRLQPTSSTQNQLNGSCRLNRRELTARRRRVARRTGRHSHRHRHHHQHLTDYRRISSQQKYTTSFQLLLPVPSDDNDWQTLLNTTNWQTVANHHRHDSDYSHHHHQ